MREPPRIAVVGAGPAGLTCAKALAESGFSITVFEKSRGLGGRLATRRREGVQFDHGAPAVAVSSPQGRAWVAAAEAAEHAVAWPGRSLADGPEWVGLPGMSGLCRPLADGLDIAFQSEVTSLRDEGSQWIVGTDAGALPFDRVVLAIPAPQAQRLLADVDDTLCRALDRVVYAPCYTLLVAFAAPPGWGDAITAPNAPFAHVMRDSSKPGRAGGAECWVAHAGAEWSRANLEMPRPDAAEALLGALDAAHGPLPPVEVIMGHRWRFSQVEVAFGQPCVASGDGRLVLGGDWTLGPLADHAVQSGAALADAVLRGS
ncbi:Dehydrosqualene desaturase [Roseivivax jejudonensis]|uniref:Dehydrosqualene desaturase n=1 Tax=Roseivivax jejudonensis TaxID=1529041 RepID=A0A1X6Y3E5_9RHOB|nr:FAD-dependent oxidoreductase [Roseivivax jejudonensis]SLN09760.1 Dehydrosqualene desaturase [Roseivivax jejudonensis]